MSIMETSPESIQKQLEQVLAGEALSKSATNRRLLAYLVQRSLDSGDGPKEVEIAIDVFGRDAGFNGAEDSVVRVSMRSLRQKLLEHYMGGGRDDPLVFDIPKGAYRVRVSARSAQATPGAPLHPLAAVPAGGEPAVAASAASAGREARRWKIAAAVLAGVLAVSLSLQVPGWLAPAPASADADHEQVRGDPLWASVASSTRPLMFVLGDLFMFTQTDPTTGRTLTVRDTLINSGEDLRALLADNPSLSSERGLRYASMLQKSAAVGMVEILHMLGNPARPVEVRLSEELRAEDLQEYDIIYLGPIARLGPLANENHVQLRYRVDAATGSVIDAESGKTYVPEGALGERHKDYALVARYPGPVGNTILVFTSGGRNAGLLQVIRTFTTPEGLQRFERVNGAVRELPPAFEALVAVSGYKQTDFAADLVQLRTLGAHRRRSSTPPPRIRLPPGLPFIHMPARPCPSRARPQDTRNLLLEPRNWRLHAARRCHNTFKRLLVTGLLTVYHCSSARSQLAS